MVVVLIMIVEVAAQARSRYGVLSVPAHDAEARLLDSDNVGHHFRHRLRVHHDDDSDGRVGRRWKFAFPPAMGRKQPCGR